MTLAAAGWAVLPVGRRQALSREATSAFHHGFDKSDSPAAEHARRRLSAISGSRGDRADAAVLEYVLDRMVALAGKAFGFIVLSRRKSQQPGAMADRAESL